MSVHTYRSALSWLAEAVPAIVVSVAQARGSAPRDAGTRMIVSATQAVGTVGGGHLELKAIEHARAMLPVSGSSAASVASLPSTVHYPLGPALGQCCGGAVTLAFAPLDQHAIAQWPRPRPLLHLQLFGAGHVGRAIARVLSMLDVTVDWIDEREAEFPASLSPGHWPAGSGPSWSDTTRGAREPWPDHIRTICVDAVEDEVRHAPEGSFYLVLTHNHDLDMRITEAILGRADFAWLGLIGSYTKRQRFLRRFEQRGIAPEVLSRMTCPIGIDGIDGKEPELIAVAVVAQMLQVAQARARTDALAAAAAEEPVRSLHV